MELIRLIKRRLIARLLLTACCLPGIAHACPSLGDYYPDAESPDWEKTRISLRPKMSECLQNSEYFALLGASQLNTGRLSQALESLERALLLDPASGAAAVDYAQALYMAGQLFPALELNSVLLSRTDIPTHLTPYIAGRQALWESETLRKGLFAELGLGFDNNLNGAPSKSDFTLTLSGEQIVLTLDEAFQPVRGPYLNARVAGYYRRLTPEYTHELQVGVRNRSSEHSQSDLNQLDWRYSFSIPVRSRAWMLSAGSSHLLYGGTPLYSVVEGRIANNINVLGCGFGAEAAVQYQQYHGQGIFSGIEAGLGGSYECRSVAQQRLIGLEVNAIYNQARDQNRPGGDRQGWKTRFYWQQVLGKGQFDAQLGIGVLDDSSSYSALLDNGAQRNVENLLIQVRYSRPLAPDINIYTSLIHQNQNSNIDPFTNHGTAMEFGFNIQL